MSRPASSVRRLNCLFVQSNWSGKIQDEYYDCPTLQVHGIAEKCVVEALAPDSTDQALDERMGNWRVGMPGQSGFGGEGADATRAEEFRESDEQVDRQEGRIAHESNVITPSNLRKTAPQGPSRLEFTNSPLTDSD